MNIIELSVSQPVVLVLLVVLEVVALEAVLVQPVVH